MYEQLSQYINDCVIFNEKEIKLINESFVAEVVPKKSFLLQAGEICDFEYFITKGCIKSYFLDQKGDETILTISTENWWVSDIASFYNRKPSKMYIETIEDCEVLKISSEAKEKLLVEVPRLERVFRLMIQNHLISYQNRLFANISLSAEERYDIFLEKFPHLPQRVPQHLIASYLGISPEFLSRIRSRKAKTF